MSAAKAVIFDLGRVLVDVDLRAGYYPFFRPPGSEGGEGLSRMMADSLFADFNTGRLGPRDFHGLFCRRFGLDHGYDEFVQRWCDVFSPVPGMYQLVAALKGRLPLALLSDTDPLHWACIRDRFPVVTLFDRRVLSFETGFRKPRREAFLAAAAAVGMPPEHCLFIDDLEENVAGALATGMAAVRFLSLPRLVENLAERGILMEPGPAAAEPGQL